MRRRKAAATVQRLDCLGRRPRAFTYDAATFCHAREQPMKPRNIVVNQPEQHMERALGCAVHAVARAARHDGVAARIGRGNPPSRRLDPRVVQCPARADQAAADARHGVKVGVLQPASAHRGPKPGRAAAPTPMERSA